MAKNCTITVYAGRARLKSFEATLHSSLNATLGPNLGLVRLEGCKGDEIHSQCLAKRRKISRLENIPIKHRNETADTLRAIALIARSHGRKVLRIEILS